MAGPTINAVNTVGSGSAGSASWSYTVTGVSANDTILLFIINNTNANPTLTPSSVTDAQGSYALLATATAAFNPNVSVWALTNANAGTHNVTVTWASAVSGAITSATFSSAGGSFVDKSAGAFLGSSTTQSVTLTNAQTNDTVVSFCYAGAAPSAQTGTAWFTGGSIGVGITGQYQAQSGTGAITPSYTYAAATFGAFVAVSLQNNIPITPYVPYPQAFLAQ